MTRHSLRLFAYLAASLCFSWIPSALADPVTESDYQKLRAVQEGEAVRDAWRQLSRAKPDRIQKAEQELAQLKASTGWSEDERRAIEAALEDVRWTIQSQTEGAITEEELKDRLAQFDPTTVATAQAHLAELEEGVDRDRAEKFVRDEIARERAGAEPTPAALEGRWVFDVDATIREILGSLATAETAKSLKAQLETSVGTPEYTFGPGATVEVRSKGPDGTDKVDRGTYRLDGHTIYFKAEGRRREEKLTAGLRDGMLLMGVGSARTVFTRG